MVRVVPREQNAPVSQSHISEILNLLIGEFKAFSALYHSPMYFFDRKILVIRRTNNLSKFREQGVKTTSPDAGCF